MAPKFERVAAGDIKAGDVVARARTHELRRVASVSHGDVAVRIAYMEGGGTDRPRLTAKWWRVAES